MTLQNELERLAELQLMKWESPKSHKMHVDDACSDSKLWKCPVITISREPGCGAGSIARMLAQELGLDLFGVELVDLIAQKAHLSRRLVATLDEKTQSAIEDMLAESSLCEEHFSSKNYFCNLSKVVFSLAAHGNAVILGRGAGFLLKPEDRLAIRLVAPFEIRVKKFMWKRKLSEQQAREHIASLEEQRRSFTRKYFHADIHDPANYDLVINTASLQTEAIIESVKAILHKMAGGRDRHSVGEWSAQVIA